MIADAVHQGYLEVRVLMGTPSGQRARLPERPWRTPERPARTAKQGEWARQLAADFGGMARLDMVADGPSPDGPMSGGRVQ